MALTQDEKQKLYAECAQQLGITVAFAGADRLEVFDHGLKMAIEHLSAQVTLDKGTEDGEEKND